jgi:ribose-phosphate pyrophosphokinase
MAKSQLQIFAGSSHPQLAAAIAKRLKMKVSPMVIERFASGEIYARPEVSVRGNDVFVIQTAGANVNEDLMELFVIMDALKRSFATNIHVVMPHYAYARQDRVALPREPITARLVADLLSAAGSDHVITVDMHSAQEQGFFDYPVDNLTVCRLFIDYFKKKKLKNPIVVAPDIGGAKMAKTLADALGWELAIVHKTRPKKNVSEVMHIVGEVEGHTCVLYDDMIDTAGTVCNAKQALLKAGANKDVYLAATHPVFSRDAVNRLKRTKFREVVVTDSIEIPKDKEFPGLNVLSIAPLLASVIKNVYTAKSVTSVL